MAGGLTCHFGFVRGHAVPVVIRQALPWLRSFPQVHIPAWADNQLLRRAVPGLQSTGFCSNVNLTIE
jgi:hypothetical protein